MEAGTWAYPRAGTVDAECDSGTGLSTVSSNEGGVEMGVSGD